MDAVKARLLSVIGSRSHPVFAEQLGEPVQRIRDVLRGKQRPPADLLVKLHQREGVDLNWLLCGTVDSGLVATPREAVLLANYRRVSEAEKADLEQKAAAAYQRFMRQEGGQRE